MILVLGTRKQYEVDSVCTELEKQIEIRVIDFLEKSEVSLEFRLDGMGRSNLYFNDFPLADVQLVWSAPRILTAKFGDTPEWAEEVIAAEQWWAVYRNIQLLMAHKTLNGADAVNKGYNKLFQLEVARNAGFAVPPTLVSNSTSLLGKFMEGHEKSITKSLGDPHYPSIDDGVSQRAIMTSSVGAEMLDHLLTYEPFPVLLQRDIQKDYELRVVVIGGKVIAFKINPHQHQIMNTDYRRGGMMVDYQKVDLGESQCDKILSLHKSFGLFSASYDFIVSVDNEFVFLEVNPFGAWAYMDNLAGGLISRTFSSEILSLSSIKENWELPLNVLAWQGDSIVTAGYLAHT